MNQEVFTPQQAVIEATRCIMCHDAPCQQGCPAGVDVPSFIRNIKTRNFAEANRTIKRANVLSGACAQVCPVNEQCQEKCSQRMLSTPIAIGKLQAFAASCEDKALPVRKEPTGKKVALVGGGPASLACAFELVRQGIQPVIFERNREVGGMLTHGIPHFRLSRDLIKREVKFVEDCGARIETGKALGKDFSLDELTEKYDAVFLGFGASEARALE
ncbi:MAG: NAD(P)-binding protein, partial [Bacteroidota bacterium]